MKEKRPATHTPALKPSGSCYPDGPEANYIITLKAVEQLIDDIKKAKNDEVIKGEGHNKFDDYDVELQAYLSGSNLALDEVKQRLRELGK